MLDNHSSPRGFSVEHGSCNKREGQCLQPNSHGSGGKSPHSILKDSIGVLEQLPPTYIILSITRPRQPFGAYTVVRVCHAMLSPWVFELDFLFGVVTTAVRARLVEVKRKDISF